LEGTKLIEAANLVLYEPAGGSSKRPKLPLFSPARSECESVDFCNKEQLRAPLAKFEVQGVQ